MREINFSSSLFSSLLFMTLFLSSPYHKAYSIDRTAVSTTLNGSVIIKLEPHGSVRAKVFQGKELQYEFILHREIQQKLITKNIDRANIYLTGKHGSKLVIDDLKTQKRFVLSMSEQDSKIENIPSAQTKPIMVKGYSVSLVTSVAL